MEATCRKAQSADTEVCADLLAQLYGTSRDEMLQEVAALIRSGSDAVLMALVDGKPAGCCHCALRRDYVEGTDTSPVGYLEGIFVLPGHRSRSLAARLLLEAEAWARAKGCRQFASDCALSNTGSQAWHQKNGFTEAGRIVCYAKDL